MELKQETYVIIHEWYLPLPGGSQTYIHEIISHFPENTKLIVFTGKHKKNSAFDKHTPYCIVRSPLWNIDYLGLRKCRIFLLFFHLCFVLWKNRPVTKIIAGYILPSGFFALLFKKIFGIPFILFTYGEELFNEMEISKVLNAIKLKIALNADLVVTISNYTKKILRDNDVPENRIVLASPGIKSDFSGRDAELVDRVRKRYTGKKVLLTVSRLEKRKGQDQVIRVMPELITRYGDNLLYLIIGSGHGPYNCEEDEKYLRYLVHSFNLTSNVFFLGSLSDEEVRAHMAVCDIFIMPNRPNEKTGGSEGFGIVFLEAAIVGKPVIGGNSGGTVDAIEDGKSGYLVDPMNLNEIKTRIMELLDNPEKAKKMGIYANTRVKKMFQWEKSSKLIWTAMKSRGSALSVNLQN